MSIIQDLKNEGALVLFHDYRSRSFYDFSGNENHGTPTDVHFAGNRGIRFPASTSVITVADSPELQLTEGTLVFFGEFLSQAANERLFYKRDAGGANYDVYFQDSPSRLFLYDGTVGRSVTVDTTGKRYIAVNMKSGEKCEGFVDGTSIGLFYETSTITKDDAPLYIGNIYTGNSPLRSTLTAALIINRKLTASEHSRLYSELSKMVWPSKGYIKTKGVYGPELVSDGDMEDAGTGSWTAVNSATLSKVSPGAVDGAQALRVAYGGATNPGVWQFGVITTGKTYLASAWMRGDGIRIPQMYHAGGFSEFHLSGSSSSDWQYYSGIFYPTTGVGILAIECITSSPGYCEFDNVSVREVIKPEIQFATTWAAEEASGLTSGWVPNTPLKINSGTWSVITEEVDGKLSKVLRCDSAGIVYLDASLMTGTPTEDAYGTWEFWVNKGGDLNNTIVYFDSINTTGTGVSGYHLKLYVDESVRLIETGVGPLMKTAAGYVSISTWYKFRVTRRDTDGQFTAYMDDTLIDVTGGSGSNPVTDNTTTTSKYMVFDLDAGDKIMLGSLDGQYGIVKMRGVWAP